MLAFHTRIVGAYFYANILPRAINALFFKRRALLYNYLYSMLKGLYH